MKHRFISTMIISSTILLVSFYLNISNSRSSSLNMAIYDVALVKSVISGGPIKYETNVPFSIKIFNQGDMPISNIGVIDYIPAGYAFNTANNPQWSADPDVAGAFSRVIPGPLAAGDSITITINLILKPANLPSDWNNKAEVYAFEDGFGNEVQSQDIDSTPDKNPTNDAPSEDDSDDQSVRVYDLALKKVNITPEPYYYFDTIDFEITVYNQGNEVTGQVTVTDYITEGYRYEPSINPSWMGNAPRPNYTFTGLAPTDSVSFVVKLILLPDMFDSGAWVNYAEISIIRDANNIVVNNNEADSRPNSNTVLENSVLPGSANDNNIFGNGPLVSEDEDDHDPATTRIVDVALKKERLTAVASYSYTQDVDFVITIENQGNTVLNQVVIVDTLVCGLEFDPVINPGWIYDASINSVRYTDTNPPAPAESKEIMLLLGVNPCFTEPDPTFSWDNFTEIESLITSDGGSNNDIDGALDNNFSNDTGGMVGTSSDNNTMGNGPRVGEDEDNHDVERVDVFDLALINEIITPEPYTYGQLLDFRVRIINQGNIVADSTELKFFIPSGYTYDVAANTPSDWVVSGNVATILVNEFIYPSDTVNRTIKLRVEESSNKLDWITRAYVNIPRDTFGINRGDDADSFPFGENPGEIAVLPNTPADNNINVLGPPGTNRDEDDHDVAGFLVADMSLIKTITSNPTLTYGSNITFNIAVTNEGGQNISQFTIVDYVPCGFTFDQVANNGWTTNTTTGYLEYTDLTGLAIGTTNNIPLTLTLVECATPTIGAWRNTAEIKSFVDEDGINSDLDSAPDDDPTNDPEGEDDISTIDLDISDLSLSKSLISSTTGLSIGSPVVFEIVITNEGNTIAENIEIRDYLPCGFTFNAGTNQGWSQVSGTTQYRYIIAGPLAPGQSETIVINTTLATCSQAGAFTNGAEIYYFEDDNNTPQDDIDSTPDDDPNNDPPGEDDIDDDGLDIFDLSLDKSLNTLTDIKYGNAISYTIKVKNEGTIPAGNIKIIDYIPCGLIFSPTANTGWTSINASNVEYAIPGILAPGDSISIPITLTLQYCSNLTSNPYRNRAEISQATNPDGDPVTDTDSTPDTNPDNDPPSEDDSDDAPLLVSDLALTKTVVNNTSYTIGDFVNYTITLTNQGNTTLNTINVIDYLPCGLGFSSTGNAGWTVSGNNIRYTHNSALAPGASTTINLRLQVKTCAGQANNWNNKAEITGGTTNSGPYNDADSTPDDNPNNDLANEDDTDNVSIMVNLPNATVGDFVWEDLNGDGTQQTGEPGIANVPIDIYNTVGMLVASTTSGPNGQYSFMNLPPGDYYIQFGVGPTYSPTPSFLGSNTNDSNVDDSNGPNTTAIFTLDSGENNNTVDGGFYKCVKICGTVWYDINNNDINDIFENGINGLKVYIFKRVGSIYTEVSFTFTGHKPGTGSDDGYFEFCTSPGEYYVKVVMPPLGLVQVRPNIGGPLNDSDLVNAFGPGTTTSFTLRSGQEKCDIKGGFYPMAVMGNLVWYDDNHNGKQDSNEPLASGIQVDLYDQGGNLLKTTTTSNIGTYKFDYLEKKEYFIKVHPPMGYGFTSAHTASAEEDSDIDHSNGYYTSPKFMMEPGVEDPKVDAGLAYGVLPVSWLGIRGLAQEDYNLIKWQVADELNLCKYEILMYQHGSAKFETIGTVQPNKDLDYSFNHYDIKRQDKFIYKVKQVDFDGRSSESDIVYVERNDEQKTDVYPNPATETIHLKTSALGGSYSITNALGQKVLEGVFSELQTSIDVSELARGNYQVTIINNNGVATTKSIILIR